MADKPRECPFCGGVSVAHIGLHVFVDALVRCEVCGAESGLFNEFDTAELNEAAAVAHWNRRFLPEGSVVVPREPTGVMTHNGAHAVLDTEGPSGAVASAVYRAMIAAATEDARRPVSDGPTHSFDSRYMWFKPEDAP